MGVETLLTLLRKEFASYVTNLLQLLTKILKQVMETKLNDQVIDKSAELLDKGE